MTSSGSLSITGPFGASSGSAFLTKPSRLFGLFMHHLSLAGRLPDRLDWIVDVHLLPQQAFPSHTHLTVAVVGFQRGLARCADQAVLPAIGELRGDVDVGRAVEVFQRETPRGRDVALDEGHARQLLITMNAVLSGDHGALDRR